MTEESLFRDDWLSQLTASGKVDILVGLPTLNNRATIKRAVDAILVGLVKHYPRERSALINADIGSKDGTGAAVKEAAQAVLSDLGGCRASNPLWVILESVRDGEGHAKALRMIFTAADLVGAKACALLSPEHERITPEWIDTLIRPVLKDNLDFVAPIYERRRFDGLLVKNILRPLIQAVYGYRIEEPVGEDLAFSGRLAAHFRQESRRPEVLDFGAHAWMTTTAMAGGYRLGQSFLGPTVEASKRSGLDLMTTMLEMVTGVFRCMEIHQPYWVSRQGSQDVPIFGLRPVLEPDSVRPDRKRNLQMFRSGVHELASVLDRVLAASTLQAIQEISKLDDKHFHFPDELWTKTVYEFASSYRRSVLNRDHLLQCLTPLYRGKAGSFVSENLRASAQEVERKLESLRQQYEVLKPYLIESWTANAR